MVEVAQEKWKCKETTIREVEEAVNGEVVEGALEEEGEGSGGRGCGDGARGCEHDDVVGE